jgi:hypothetical protein
MVLYGAEKGRREKRQYRKTRTVNMLFTIVCFYGKKFILSSKKLLMKTAKKIDTDMYPGFSM